MGQTAKQTTEHCILVTALAEAGDVLRAVTEATGEPPDPNAKAAGKPLILCADGGYAAAQRAGVIPDAVIGDFDSLAGGAPDVPDCVKVVALPAEKDDTDTLAAAKLGVAHGCRAFCVVGGLSGRFDHSYAVLQTLSYLADMGCQAQALDGQNRCLLLAAGRGGRASLTLEPAAMFPDGSGRGQGRAAGQELDSAVLPSCRDGQSSPTRRYFSVFSYSERSEGVTITGARYPLTDAVLTHSYPLGVSNEFVDGACAAVSLRTGRLLIVVSEEAAGAAADGMSGG
jgi:thiamine pyrophosphokinase